PDRRGPRRRRRLEAHLREGEGGGHPALLRRARRAEGRFREPEGELRLRVAAAVLTRRQLTAFLPLDPGFQVGGLARQLLRAGEPRRSLYLFQRLVVAARVGEHARGGEPVGGVRRLERDGAQRERRRIAHAELAVDAGEEIVRRGVAEVERGRLREQRLDARERLAVRVPRPEQRREAVVRVRVGRSDVDRARERRARGVVFVVG